MGVGGHHLKADRNLELAHFAALRVESVERKFPAFDALFFRGRLALPASKRCGIQSLSLRGARRAEIQTRELEPANTGVRRAGTLTMGTPP